MTENRMLKVLLDALAIAWLNDDICIFATVDEYMDCVRQVKEKFQ